MAPAGHKPSAPERGHVGPSGFLQNREFHPALLEFSATASFHAAQLEAHIRELETELATGRASSSTAGPDHQIVQKLVDAAKGYAP